jgi:hypothetical protein
MIVRVLMAYRRQNDSPYSGGQAMDHLHASKIPRPRNLSRLLTGLLSLAFPTLICLCVPSLGAGDTKGQTEPFPDTTALLAAVIQHERAVDPELQSLVFKDDITVSALDRSGQVRSTRTETRCFSASGYHPFALHITTNGKSLNIPFSEIFVRSRLVPLKWSELEGTPVIVFSFEPQSHVAKHGDLEDRIAGDLNGTVWVSPNDASIVRLEFRSVQPIALGWGYLGRIESLEGSLAMREVAGNLWLPALQEFVTQGKNVVAVVAGIRFSKSFHTQQADELSRYAPAFDMVQVVKPSPLHYGD